MRVAVATLCVGERYLSAWNKHFRAGWEAWAARCGHELVVFDAPLDRSPRAAARSPAWQKCLVLGHPRLAGFDRVVWLDADVFVGPAAPPFAALVPPGLVGGVISGSHVPRELRGVFLRRVFRLDVPFGEEDHAWRGLHRSFYRRRGLPERDEVVQTGVLVLSPEHRPLLEEIYATDQDFGRTYEQMPLSSALLERGLLHRLDPRLNYVLSEHIAATCPFVRHRPPWPDQERLVRLYLATQVKNAFLLHFANTMELAPLLPAPR